MSTNVAIPAIDLSAVEEQLVASSKPSFSKKMSKKIKVRAWGGLNWVVKPARGHGAGARPS